MPPPERTIAADYHFHTYDWAGAAPFTLSLAQPERNNLQFYSLAQDLAGLLAEGVLHNVPNIALANVGGPTVGGLRTKVLSFGNAGGAANPPTVVITGGIHAREWIAAEMAYLLAEYLIVNYNPVPQGRYQQAIRNLVDSRRIHIIPMLNPDGNDYTVFSPEGGAREWRKNRRSLPATGALWVAALAPGGVPNPPFANVQAPPPGEAQYEVPDYDPANRIPPRGPPHLRQYVLADNEIGVDLNRNYNTAAWGYACADRRFKPPNYVNWDPASNSYFGTSAGSEIETGNVAGHLAGLGAVATAIDYHSYGQLILYPCEAFNNGAVGFDYRTIGETLQQLVRSQAALDYQLGASGQLFKYEATGTVIDHLAQFYQARAFTIELDPVLGNAIGFQLPENQIQTVFEKNIRGALAAIAAPAPANGVISALRNRITVNASERQFLRWNVYGRGNRLPV
jgi:Zinc carboxypeptidase